MADITIKLVIAQINTKEDVEVPDSSPIAALCAALGEEYKIPSQDKDGHPINYKLENLTQKFIYDHKDTLSGRGTRPNDTCALTYEYVAG